MKVNADERMGTLLENAVAASLWRVTQTLPGSSVSYFYGKSMADFLFQYKE